MYDDVLRINLCIHTFASQHKIKRMHENSFLKSNHSHVTSPLYNFPNCLKKLVFPNVRQRKKNNEGVLT